MQMKSMNTPERRDGALLRTARAVGKWFSRAFTAINAPYERAPDRWSDWPRFPPY